VARKQILKLDPLVPPAGSIKVGQDATPIAACLSPRNCDKEMAMMHILLLAPAVEDYCVEYANALSARAMVTMLAPARLFSEYAPFVDKAVDLRLLNWPRHRSPANIVFLPRLVRLIGTLQPSVVHFLAEGVVWLNLLVLCVRESAIVTTMHDVSYHPGDRSSQRVPRWFANRLVSGSDKVIVHGAGLKQDTEQRYPHLAGRVEMAPHLQLRRYLDIARNDKMSRTDDPTVNILFFGRIFAYKGLDFLIRSAPLVTARCDNIRVIIAGTGDDMDVYRTMIVEPRFFDIRNRHISDCETAQLFTDADIVVLPYTEASQSGVLAIANTFGKPVIVSNVGELGRSVEHDKTGIVVPAQDEQALAQAIIRLVTDPALRTRLGEAGRAAAERSASPELVATKALEIYQRAIEAAQDGRPHRAPPPGLGRAPRTRW
jgi:glycosyltransferase involved in cell wall biosynthesis